MNIKTKKYNKVIITGNVLRYPHGQTYDTPWLYPMFKYLLNSFSNVYVEMFHYDIAKEFYKKFYKSMNIENPSVHSWIDIYNQDNNETSLRIISEYFQDSLVIAFELHPILQKGFDILNIPNSLFYLP